jgi:hypothetical protein
MQAFMVFLPLMIPSGSTTGFDNLPVLKWRCYEKHI